MFTHNPICFRDIEGINEKVDPHPRITNAWDIGREGSIEKAVVMKDKSSHEELCTRNSLQQEPLGYLSISTRFLFFDY